MNEVMVGVAKAVLAGRMNYPRETKATLYKAMQRLADMERRAGETAEAAFARVTTETEDGVILMRAHNVATGPNWVPPAPVEKAAEHRHSAAYDRLLEKAAEIRKVEPALTKEQAFEKVYTDPDNRDLVDLYKRSTSGAAA